MSEAPAEKPVLWPHGKVKTPPFTREGRIEAGTLLGRLQQGETLGMPHARPMPSIGPRCFELRVRDKAQNWRIMYHLDDDAILILDVFAKKTQKTPDGVIDRCQQRLRRYNDAKQGAKGE